MITAELLLAYLLSAIAPVGIDAETSKIDTEQAYCLAKNIYYEARSESVQGQYAVAHVTLNRANDSRFPSTICDVVKQTSIDRESKKVTCQFSWYCENDRKGKDILVKNKDGSINQKIADQFQTASAIAIAVLNGDVKDNTNGATHFHNPNVAQPDWTTRLRKTKSIGNHDFYKLPSRKTD